MALVRFFRSSFAGQYIATGLFGIVIWGTVLPSPPPMPEPSGPVILYSLLYNLLSGYPVLASLAGFVTALIAAMWLNLLFTRHEIIPKNSSLAAFLFLLFSCWNPAQMTLTPLSIPLLLFLSVFQSLLEAYNRHDPVDLAFSAGFMITVSALFYLPSIFFYGFLLTVFLVYRSIHWREWAASFIGLLTPVLFLAVYWFWTDQIPDIVKDYADFFRDITLTIINPWNEPGRVIPAAFLVLFLLTGIFYNARQMAEKTIETRKKLIILSWFSVWVLITYPFAKGLLLFHPSLAFLSVAPFLAGFYLSKKKTFLWEMILWIYIGVIVFNQVLNLFQ